MRLAPALLAAPLAVALAFAAPAARAQCGATVSTCRQCHEVREARAVLHDGRAWHADHAFGDFCAGCHGGSPRAEDAAVAHVGLADPLAESGAACVSCHGSEASALAAPYLAARDAARVSSVANAIPEAHPARHDGALAIVVAAVACASLLVIVTNERRRRASEGGTR